MKSRKMCLTAALREFWASEEGLVTVEWVALSGAIIAGAIAIGWLVMDGLKGPAATIGNTVSTASTPQ